MSLFTDAKTVMINNKEVQSITLQNGEKLYEKPPSYNLSLTSNKGVIQTGETVTLTATLTDAENTAMSGETILFDGLTVQRTISPDTSTVVGDSYKIISLPTFGPYDYVSLNEEESVIMGNANSVITLYVFQNSYTNISDISVDNGVISFYENNNPNKISIDISSTSINKIFTTNTGLIIEEYTTGVTDSNGVATATYTGTAKGEMSIQAQCTTNNNTISSNTCNVTDACYYKMGSISNNFTVSNLTTIPVNFKATVKITSFVNISSSEAGVRIGADEYGNNIYFGRSPPSTLVLRVRNNYSDESFVSEDYIYLENVEIETVYTYIDGVQTVTANNVTKTVTNSNVTARNYLNVASNNAIVKDLVITPINNNGV